ncbi:hypothetical protein [Aeromonas salmonicida]|uniref:hypothetical protein n=1 Tax=Aeromonas salmonicida TaxID=645 RepID=UPI0012D88330|nr:hypothetical protein [Aeromonas salmonicida]
MVTSPDIENQQNCLMFDAVSAHTDCLIQIVKERHACRVEEAHITLLTSKVKRLFSLFFRRRLSQGSWLIRLACSAVLVGAHYREPRRDDKGFLQKCVRLLKKQAEVPKTKILSLYLR